MYKKTRLIFQLLLLSFLLIQLSFCQNTRDLTILYWNDFHSQNIPAKADKKYYPEIKDSVVYVGGSAYFKAYLNKYKEIDKNIVILNAGDDFQGSPVSTVTNGRSQIELMNLINPDAMTLGNHEFDYSSDTLFKHLKIAKFDIISANLLSAKTNNPIFKPYKVMNINGIKVAIIGLMTTQLPTLAFPDNIKDLKIGDVYTYTKKYINQLKETEKPDIFVILSHCGFDVDEKLADKIPEIDIIIGGHSHTILKKPVMRNKTIICQAGDRGKLLGRLNLIIDIKADSIVSYKGELIPTLNSLVSPDLVMKEKVESLEKFASLGLEEIIGYLETDWTRSRDGESNIGNWQTDAIKEFAKTDISFQNAGGIRRNQTAGNITIKDIWEINPFGNSIVKFSLPGDSLLLMLEHQTGSGVEKLQVSGLKYSYDSNEEFGKRIKSLIVNNKNLDPKKYYSISTNSYVGVQGKKFFSFDVDRNSITDMGILDRDLFIEAIKKQKRINSGLEDRIVKIKK